MSANNIAITFAKHVRESVSESDLIEIIEQNYDNDGCICATHDYIDSNELMLAAMQQHGVVIDMHSSEFAALWNAAWTIAKDADFYHDVNEFRR